MPRLQCNYNYYVVVRVRIARDHATATPEPRRAVFIFLHTDLLPAERRA